MDRVHISSTIHNSSLTHFSLALTISVTYPDFSDRAYTHEFPGSRMTTGNNIALALRTAYLALHRRSDAAFAAHGVTADQFVLLATLSRGHALTQRELARRMSSDPSTVQAMLVLLERRGFIVRETHTTDARARTVSLTATGKMKFRKLWAAGDPIRAQMLEALQPGEAETLFDLLSRIAEALNGECAAVAGSTLSHSPGDES
jgi:DNA-binding MarR family transcriptional regulator